MQETQETWVRSLGLEDPLKQETATHSSILAGRISWTEEPGGPRSMGWRSVRQNCVTEDAYTQGTATAQGEHGL